MDEGELRKRITAIHLDPNLTEKEKAVKRQELLSGQWAKPAAEEEPESSTGMSSFAVLTQDSAATSLADQTMM